MLKFDWSIIWTFVNVIILFLFLKKFLFKPVTTMMEKREKEINTSLKEAEDNKAEALKLKSDYEGELKLAEEKAADIIKEARERAELEYNKQLYAAKEEAEKVMIEASKTIELEKKKSLQDAQAEIAGIAMLAASKVIAKNVDDNTNKQFLGEFLKEVGAAK